MCCEEHRRRHRECCCHEAGWCCEEGQFRRRYRTKAEEVAELQAYLNELKTEIQAVEERLAELT